MKSLESVYQSSKVFSRSGQIKYLIDLDPFEAKKEIRARADGDIIAFRFEGKDFPTEPKNAFYDWLYIKSIKPHEKCISNNLNYAGYSDIEFTPDRSINCQGRAVAEFHALTMRNSAAEYADDFEGFRNLLMYAQRRQ
jgi:hypothetical protein